MRRICFGVFVALLTMVVGCDTSDEPARKIHFHTVNILDKEAKYVVPAEGEVWVPFEVVDSDAFALSDYTIELHHEGSLRKPTEVELLRVLPGEQVGHYEAVVAATGVVDSFSIVVTLSFLGEGGTIVRSDSFALATSDASMGLFNFRFLRSLNPALGGDVWLDYDSSQRLLTGATPNFVESLELVASFECEGRVSVDGQVQTSGESRVDFSQEVVYVVEYEDERVEYKVRLTNFTGLPVMVINTADGTSITSKEVWKDATIAIYGAGRFDDLKECDVEIRGRGNSTWGYDKKPYALKFPSKTPILGMPKHKRWVMLANTMDRTMLRNRVAYHVASLTSLAWTPRTEYVDVMLNGKYVGNYLIAEQIRIDTERIDIAELEPDDNEGEAITGGYVYEMDFHFDNVNQWWTREGFPTSVKFPDEDDITAEQLEWATDYFNTVERVIYGDKFDDPEEGYASLIDPQSFVDYWLVYEICINHELANPGSVYLHKDRGGKLTAGPVWDFDWGTFSYNASPQAQGRLFMTQAIWYERLFEDDAFWQLAKERWAVLYEELVAVEEFIRSEAAYLGYSAKRNFEIWNPATTGSVNGDERITFDAAVERMVKIYTERIETLNGLLR